MICRQEAWSLQQEQQVIEVDRLDKVGIETGFLRTLPIRILSVARHRHQGQQFQPGSSRQRRATS